MEDFNSAKEADEAVNAKGIWKKCDSYSTADGLKVRYRCTAAKYRCSECPASLYLLFHSTSKKVSMFQTEGGHANHKSDPTRGLSNDVKRFIRAKFEDGITKPNALLTLMRNKKMTEPPKAKLITYLRVLREEKFGTPSVSAHDIRTWCESRTNIPTDVDEPFVLRFDVSAESPAIEDQTLRIVLSSQRLLQNMKPTRLAQTDAIYLSLIHI